MRKLVPLVLLALISCASPSGSHAPPTDLPAPAPEFWHQIREAGDGLGWSCGRCEQKRETSYVCVNCHPRDYEAIVDFTIDCINTDRENDAVADRQTDVLQD
ncbi:MAG: hypothetical protein ACYSUN_11320 [Planctomycetota bacterium]